MPNVRRLGITHRWMTHPSRARAYIITGSYEMPSSSVFLRLNTLSSFRLGALEEGRYSIILVQYNHHGHIKIFIKFINKRFSGFNFGFG
ncbi:MAG: hypothetical protein ACTSRP_12600 [Candidatus Helarchaeota archaeon]